MEILKSVYFWIAGILLTMAMYYRSLAAAIFFPKDKKRDRVHLQCKWWADSLINMGDSWELKVNGLENIDKNKTYVIVANHESMADIFVMYKIGIQFRWVAKEELFKIPFLGGTMKLGKQVRLLRGDFSSIKQVYREAAVWLKGGTSVIFFPEGTRSKTGEIGEFQNGAFKLAIKLKLPVLPVAIVGTRDIIQSGKKRVSSEKIKASINVLKPIETGAYAIGEFEKLKDLSRKVIEECKAARRHDNEAILR